jgi:hypothetical protein
VTVTFRLVITDTAASVLLVEQGSRWALPRMDGDEPEVVIDVAPTMRDVAGTDVIVLHDLRFGPMPPPEDAVVFVTEPIADAGKARGRWWRRGDGLDRVVPGDRAALRAWADGGERRSLQPWQRAGWFSEARDWIGSTLPRVTEVHQYATWANSCVLSVASEGGRAWFKATIAYFETEPVVTELIGELLPGWAPTVLGVDADRGWMLLEDLDGVPVDTLPVDERLDALLAVGELHRASVGLVDRLLEGSCRDRRPIVLAGQIAELAADPGSGVPEALAERLRAATPRLGELCDAMTSSPIAPTLVHGDLHGGNIMRTADGYVPFDWSDACVADRYVDVLLFLTRVSKDQNVRAAFLERYLEAWPGVSRAALAEYVELAEPLAAMHQAVTYRALADVFGEDAWFFGDTLARWIEHALACPVVGD